jgi:hypothetical protein
MIAIRRTIGMLSLLLGLVLATPSARAGSIGDFLESLIRAGRKAERVPTEGRILKRLDELPRKNLPKLNQAETVRRFERLEHVDDSLRRQFRELPLDQRIIALELGEAAQRVLRRSDDGLEVLRKLDGDGLVQLRTYGDFVADGVRLAGPEYKLVVRKTDSGANQFLTRYLKPHYKELVAAGLVAAYLSAPEKFHDAAGNLTAWAAEQLTRLGIEVTSAAPRGIWRAIVAKFTEDPLFSTIGTGLTLTCLVLAVPRVRWHVWRWFQPLFSIPQAQLKDDGDAKMPRHFQE